MNTNINSRLAGSQYDISADSAPNTVTRKQKHRSNRRRSHTVTFRMNDEEYQMLQNKLLESDLTQQALITNAIGDIPVATPEEISILKDVAARYEDIDQQIHGIAGNMNQQTRNLNLLINLLQDSSLNEEKVQETLRDLPTLEALKMCAQWLGTYRKEVNDQWQFLRQFMVRQKATRD